MGLQLKKKGWDNNEGEVIEVHGGRIVRSLGRKDRHSKVCTARGPRDRRVRLSPNTAIQFYDVQDRLGYDRPSKAIDWLLKEAKSAIDALADNDSTEGDYDLNNSASLMHQNNHHPSLQELQDPHSKYSVQNPEQLSFNPTGHMSFLNMENGATFHTCPPDFNLLNSRNYDEAQGLSVSAASLQSSYPNGSVLFSGENQYGDLSSLTSLHSQISSQTATLRRFLDFDANNHRGSEEFYINQVFHPQREPLQSSLYNPIRASSHLYQSNVNYSNPGFPGERLSRLGEQNPIPNKPSSSTSNLQE